jgi:hypothetical protein
VKVTGAMFDSAASKPVSLVSDVSTTDESSDFGERILTVKTQKELLQEIESLKRLIKRKNKEAEQAAITKTDDDEDKKKEDLEQQDGIDEEEARPLKITDHDVEKKSVEFMTEEMNEES